MKNRIILRSTQYLLVTYIIVSSTPTFGMQEQIQKKQADAVIEKSMWDALHNHDLSSLQKIFAGYPAIDVNARDGDKTPLMFASTWDEDKIVEFLINNKADVNAVDNDGDSALMVAITNGHLASAKVLIDNGADVNQQNHAGYTPLMLAAQHNKLKIFQLLVAAGADLASKNEKDNDQIALAYVDPYKRQVYREAIKKGKQEYRKRVTSEVNKPLPKVLANIVTDYLPAD